MKTVKQLRRRLVALEISSIVVAIAPLLIAFIVRWDVYTKHYNPLATVKLSIGGAMLLALVAIVVLGKFKLPSRLVCCVIFFVLAFALEEIMQDIVFIATMLLLGVFTETVAFSHAIRVTRQNIQIRKTSDQTTVQVKQAVSEVLKDYGGRV